MLNFFGITDISVVRAEGLALGDAARGKALLRAQAQIDAMAPRAAA